MIKQRSPGRIKGSFGASKNEYIFTLITARLHERKSTKSLYAMNYCIEVNLDGTFTCLPEDLDRTALIEVACIGSRGKTFLDSHTGETHDSQVYWDKWRMLKETLIDYLLL